MHWPIPIYVPLERTVILSEQDTLSEQESGSVSWRKKFKDRRNSLLKSRLLFWHYLDWTGYCRHSLPHVLQILYLFPAQMPVCFYLKPAELPKPNDTKTIKQRLLKNIQIISSLPRQNSQHFDQQANWISSLWHLRCDAALLSYSKTKLYGQIQFPLQQEYDCDLRWHISILVQFWSVFSHYEERTWTAEKLKWY